MAVPPPSSTGPTYTTRWRRTSCSSYPPSAALRRTTTSPLASIRKGRTLMRASGVPARALRRIMTQAGKGEATAPPSPPLTALPAPPPPPPPLTFPSGGIGCAGRGRPPRATATGLDCSIASTVWAADRKRPPAAAPPAPPPPPPTEAGAKCSAAGTVLRSPTSTPWERVKEALRGGRPLAGKAGRCGGGGRVSGAAPMRGGVETDAGRRGANDRGRSGGARVGSSLGSGAWRQEACQRAASARQRIKHTTRRRGSPVGVWAGHGARKSGPSTIRTTPGARGATRQRGRRRGEMASGVGGRHKIGAVRQATTTAARTPRRGKKGGAHRLVQKHMGSESSRQGRPQEQSTDQRAAGRGGSPPRPQRLRTRPWGTRNGECGGAWIHSVAAAAHAAARFHARWAWGGGVRALARGRVREGWLCDCAARRLVSVQQVGGRAARRRGVRKPVSRTVAASSPSPHQRRRGGSGLHSGGALVTPTGRADTRGVAGGPCQAFSRPAVWQTRGPLVPAMIPARCPPRSHTRPRCLVTPESGSPRRRREIDVEGAYILVQPVHRRQDVA